jgi:hypothetical protein
VLLQLVDQQGIHGLLAGRACRLLFDTGVLPAEEVGWRMDRALPGGRHDWQQTKDAADWLDGFVRDSGLILVHDVGLWRLVDGWIGGLARERFQEALPLLRRAFSTFPEAIRRQLQERARFGAGAGPRVGNAAAEAAVVRFNQEQADSVLAYAQRLLGQ